MTTQTSIILKVLHENGQWMPSHFFIKQNTPYGYLGIATTRRLRELAEANKIQVRHTGKFAEYRIKKEPLQVKLF